MFFWPTTSKRKKNAIMKKSAFVARDVVHAMTNCDAEIIDRQFYDDTSEKNLILQHF